jgi:ADP-ribose pyrophosphatase
MASAPPGGRLVSRRYAYEGNRIRVRLDDVAYASGGRRTYEVVEHPGAAAIVPVTPDQQVLLVRQFRQAVGATLLEIPAGTLEPGETFLACAQRELAEEVARAADRWDTLSVYYPSPGVLSEVLHIFLAQGLRPATATHEEEDLQVESLQLEDACRRIGTEIRYSKSILGIMMARARLGGAG